MQKSKSFVVILLLLLLTHSCEEPNINDPGLETKFGISGKVMDENGNNLDGVTVYCLFNNYYFPNDIFQSDVLECIAQSDSFAFNLFQNFPNPFYNSSFIRFSIPTASEIEFSIQEKISKKNVYTLTGNYQYGLYQVYLNGIVAEQQLENGNYSMTLKTIKNSNILNKAEKSIFIISDLGKPSCITRKDGIYFFSYKKALIGDTIIYAPNDFYTDTLFITKDINFFFRKNGYKDKIINAVLYPSLLINTDVVMEKGGVK